MDKYTLKFIGGKVYKEIQKKEFADIILELYKENEELQKENKRLRTVLGIEKEENEDNVR